MAEAAGGGNALLYATPEELLGMVKKDLAELMRRFKEALEQVCEDRPLRSSDIQLPILRPPASPAVTQSIPGYEGGAYDPRTLGVACIVIPSAEFRGSNNAGDFNLKSDGKKLKTAEAGLIRMRMSTRPHAGKSAPDLDGTFYKFLLEQPAVDFLASNRPWPFVVMHMPKPGQQTRVAAPPRTTAVNAAHTPADAPSAVHLTASEITPDESLEEVSGLVERLNLTEAAVATSAASYGSSSDDDNGNSSDDEMEDAMRRYLPKLRALMLVVKELEWMLPKVAARSLDQRAAFVMANVEDVYTDLMARPRVPPEVFTGGDCDELTTLTAALRLGWALLPDSWTGLLVVLDVLAERSSSKDIARIAQDVKTLETLKTIAQTNVWPNNRRLGMMVPAAKALLSRCSSVKQGPAGARPTAASFAEASTIGIVRVERGLSLEGGQPKRPSRGSCMVDQRHVCAAAGCMRIEQGTTKFDKCGNCCSRDACPRYCSRECQKKHWRGEHKATCMKEDP